MDQLLKRVSWHKFYCSGYTQIEIDLEDQEKTTFTCPFGTVAYRRMPFGLCNAPVTFQRCMLSIFGNMVEDFMEVFMDNFSVFGSNFDNYLDNLQRVLKRCEKKNLVLNWEVFHFMVTQEIVLGYMVSAEGIQVDKAKIDLIFGLPILRYIRSFLGHTGFYRCFIKDFSAISRPLSHLLMKDVPFEWIKECQASFEMLKTLLTTTPIL